MKKNWEINPEAFEKMLLWLDENRDIAGRKYEAIRLRLTKIFDYRQCPNSDELTDKVFDRVLLKIKENAVSTDGSPSQYFFNTANNIYREYLRKPTEVELSEKIPVEDENDNFDPYYECLERCLITLSAEKRKLILAYYEEERKAKIDYHKWLAEALGLELNVLHLRVFRIRKRLQKCVLKCIERKKV